MHDEKAHIEIFFSSEFFSDMEDIDLVDDLSIEMANQCRHLIKTKRMQKRYKEERDSVNQITEEAERLTEPLNLCHNLVEHGSFFPMMSRSGATYVAQKEIRHWEYDVILQKRVPRI